MGWMQEVPMLLCHALGWRAWQEYLRIFYGLKLHIPGRSPAGSAQHCSLPGWAYARCPCVFIPSLVSLWEGGCWLVFYAGRKGQQALPEGPKARE